jgi:uncharacterized short protein YbdD (DUF466 family)
LITSRDALVSRLTSVARRIAAVTRTVVGVPDYERYVKHMHSHHPECTPLTREEFVKDSLERRYSRPGNRCC